MDSINRLDWQKLLLLNESVFILDYVWIIIVYYWGVLGEDMAWIQVSKASGTI